MALGTVGGRVRVRTDESVLEEGGYMTVGGLGLGQGKGG